jgi:hypothetical protein
MDFKEETEVQLLLLSSQEVKAVDPSSVFAGTVYINVGNGGAASTFGAISTADDNTSYTSFDSNITGETITYTDHVVIVRYKTTKIVVVEVPSYGFLNFNEDNVWSIEPEHIKKKMSIVEKDVGSGGGFTSSISTIEVVGMELKSETHGKLYITTDPDGEPQYTTDTTTGAGYMVNHLEVDGKILAKEFCVPSVDYPSMTIVYSGQHKYHPNRTDTWGGVKCERLDAQHIRGSNFYDVEVLGYLTVTGTKQFKISHPILENKFLLHSCIESPRVENLYRGIKQLINGKCEINIDRDCNENGGLTEGTYESFNRHSQLFLQNHNTFDRLKGIITGNRINVICEDDTANYEINWMVISERCDKNIIEATTTDENGRLKCEVEN